MFQDLSHVCCKPGLQKVIQRAARANTDDPDTPVLNLNLDTRCVRAQQEQQWDNRSVTTVDNTDSCNHILISDGFQKKKKNPETFTAGEQHLKTAI